MIEFDVDMGYLLEEGELDRVVLNDENGEHEPMTFYPSGGECEFVGNVKYPPKCSVCGWQAGTYDCKWLEDGEFEYDGKFCKECGAKVKAVKR